MMDQMDVGEPTVSTSSFEKLDPAELDLKALNNSMKECYDILMWQHHIGITLVDNTSMWQQLFLEVLKCLTRTLAATDVIIPTLSDDSADDIVKGYKDKVEEWKAGVWSSVETNDWSNLFQTIG